VPWSTKEDSFMVKGPRVLDRRISFAGLILSLTVACLALPAAANEVVLWNETTAKAIDANGQNNVVATRTLAMVQVAMHDALNAISRRYDAYYFEGPGDPAASPDAATAAAAHTVLVGVVGSFGTPAQKVLRVTTALLLIGHGGFDFAMHKNWTGYAAAVGISPATLAAHPLTPLAGWLECALGLLVLAWPTRGVLLFIVAWKLGTEALRPLAGEPIWEFIERGGSYGAPLALAWIQNWRRTIGASGAF
jgi:hypothetical protein